jgi:hypothetical protein
MKASGLTEEAMHRWHAELEKAAPEEHREFLEYLHIPATEIRSMRDRSKYQASELSPLCGAKREFCSRYRGSPWAAPCARASGLLF